MDTLLPRLQARALPADLEGFCQELAALCQTPAGAQGYCRVVTPEREHYLLLLRSKPFSGGLVEHERFGLASVQDTFNALASASAVDYCQTDLPLFLCTAVLFRKAPSAQLPADLVDSQALLTHLKKSGKDVVLVVRRGAARNLVFCRNGDPAVIYPAPGANFATAGSITERLMEYIYGGGKGAGTILDLFGDIHVPAAPDGGRPLAEYLAAARAAASAAPQRQPSLIVKLGERAVFRFPILQPQLSIGRSLDNDLPLDDMTVSRRHALLRRDGEQLTVEDLGSENGLVVGGRRVLAAELRPGDEVGVGQYSLLFARPGDEDAVLIARPPLVSSRSTSEGRTVALDRDDVQVDLEHRGKRYPMQSAVFLIGTHAMAHLRIRGWFVAPIHAQIDAKRGSYSIKHLAGRRALQVNGATVASATLNDGDRLRIGGEEILFHRTQRLPPA